MWHSQQLLVNLLSIYPSTWTSIIYSNCVSSCTSPIPNSKFIFKVVISEGDVFFVLLSMSLVGKRQLDHNHLEVVEVRPT